MIWEGLPIPHDWEIVPFSTQHRFHKGLSITKADLVDTGIPVVNYGQVHSKENTSVRLSRALLRYLPDNFNLAGTPPLAEGDLVFADTSEDLTGVGAFVRYTADSSNVVFPGSHILVASPEQQLRHPYFAYLYLSDAWRNQIRRLAMGAKVYSVTQSLLKECSVLLPPTEVQDRIVRFLDEETAKIDNLIKKQESLKDLYSERVVTARNQLLDDVQGEDIRLRWVFSPSAERAHGDEQVLSVYRDYGVIPKESRSDNHNVTPVDISNYRVVAPGDLVINKMKAWQGSLGISRYEGVVSGDYEVLHQTDTRFDSSFLHHFLRSRRMISQYAIRSKGIRPSQWRLYWDEFSEITIPLIPMEQQTGLVGLISEIELQDGLIEKCDRMVELLQERRSALITAAVTGQIEV